MMTMEPFPIHTLGKSLIVIGGILALAGLAILLAGKIPFLGKLPGDISIKGKDSAIYFPIATCVIVSILLTFLANLFFRK